MHLPRVLALLACAALGCAALGCAAFGCDTRRSTATVAASSPREAPAPPARPRGFLKGQLHAHTGNSGDSETDPAEAAAWYAARGYDFVVFTDHNVVTEVAAPPGMLLMPGVELTQNLRTCDPPPGPREGCLLHVNALFVSPSLSPSLAPSRERMSFPVEGSIRRADLYGQAVARALSMGGLAQLDHPNFHRGADLEVLLALTRRGLTLVEIANEAIDSNNEGDTQLPSTEALWDAALSRGARVLGTATDDAHHYGDAARVRARGGVAYTGDRGFVMVWADKTPEAVRAAVAAGAFYASTGAILDRAEVSDEAITIDARGPSTFEVIADGRVIETTRGLSLRHDPRGSGAAWTRVRVTDAAGKKAFTQPAWRR